MAAPAGQGSVKVGVAGSSALRQGGRIVLDGGEFEPEVTRRGPKLAWVQGLARLQSGDKSL